MSETNAFDCEICWSIVALEWRAEHFAWHDRLDATIKAINAERARTDPAKRTGGLT